MKKLFSLGVILFLSVLSIVTASPLPLLIPAAPQAYTILRLSDVDVTAITAFAANNQKALIASLFNGLDIANDVMVHPGVKNKIPMPKLKVGNGFRPFSSTPEYKAGGAVYTDRYLEVSVGKRELYIDIEAYRQTYLVLSNSAGSNASKFDIPFAQFLWEQVILNVQREINDETAYKGFDKADAVLLDTGDAYVVGDIVTFATATNNPNSVLDYYVCVTNAAAGETPDTHPAKWQYASARAVAVGIEQRILDGITATEIAPVTTGAINSTAGVAIAAFKELFRSWNAAYKRNGIIISCSYTDYEFLMDDLGDKYKALKDDASANGYLVLPETEKRCFVKPATWLGSSRRLISGPVFMEGANPKHMNLFLATDMLNDFNTIETQKDKWMLWAGIKGCVGFNYQDSEAIKVGDQS